MTNQEVSTAILREACRYLRLPTAGQPWERLAGMLVGWSAKVSEHQLVELRRRHPGALQLAMRIYPHAGRKSG